MIAALQRAGLRTGGAEGCVGGGTGMICYEFKVASAPLALSCPNRCSNTRSACWCPGKSWFAGGPAHRWSSVGEEISNLLPEPDEAMYMNSILIIVATDAPLLNDSAQPAGAPAADGVVKNGKHFQQLKR